MGKRLLARALLCGAVLTMGPRAHAQDAASPPAPLQDVLEGRNVRVTSGSSSVVVELGCAGRASLRAENRLFVACGVDGVVEIDLTNPLAPRRVGRMPVDGDATGLFLRDGRVWVEVAHVDARPVRTEAQAAAVQTTASLPAYTPSQATTDVASATAPAPRRSLVAPPRRGGLWELSAMVGAFANLGPLGGGGMGWASAVYRFDAPIVVRAELAPLGVGIGQRSTSTTSTFNGFNQSSATNPTGATAVAAGHLLVGFDTQFVEVAVGGGGATISNSSSFGPNGTSATPAAGGASIVEEGRLGARDGLALNVESTTVAANNQFQFGSFVASIQVPLTPSVMLIVRGGGGNVGLLFGDLGARYVVRGDGGPDTIALTGFFGGAGIDFQSCSATGGTSAGSVCQSISLGGPSIGGGVEWRR
jgi:hypothetical protein